MSLFRNWISWLVWVLIALAGAFSLMVLSLVRGEEVNALWMVVASLCTFAIAYRFHSAWLIARVLSLDAGRALWSARSLEAQYPAGQVDLFPVALIRHCCDRYVIQGNPVHVASRTGSDGKPENQTASIWHWGFYECFTD